MTEFTKTKIHFAIVLLGTLFALHPFLDRFADVSFDYLGYELKVWYAYSLLAALLTLVVYCYGLALVSERPNSWLEKTGNSVYALAIMVAPLFGGLYLASLLANLVGHSDVAWAAPAVAVGLGVGWVLVSQLVAWRLRWRLSSQDQKANVEKLAEQEIAALKQGREMFLSDHFDLSVIDAWKAVEARLRRVLLARRIVIAADHPQRLIDAASKDGIIGNPARELLQELRRLWAKAVGVEPTSKESADVALHAARTVLATVAVDDLGRS